MKKIFIGFAIEDKFARDHLVYQARQDHTPFEFIDMSVKQPWDFQWKTNCRARIRQCHGMIAFVSDNTINADGARWEIQCAYDEGIRVYPVYIHDYGVKRLPPELSGRRIYHWTWPNITGFLNSL
jgi:antiphage defense system Thoeris ThsB-like protein